MPFFGIGMKTELSQSWGHCWVFQICWHIECNTFTASPFRIWNSSTGNPSPPLWKKQENSRKTSISVLLTVPKTLTVWITINCGKFWERWECQTTWHASWEICMQVRKQQLELDMEQQTGSKYEKGVHQGCLLPPYLLNLFAEYSMRNTGLEETKAGIKIAGRNINNFRYALPGEISITSDMQMTPPLWQKVKKN